MIDKALIPRTLVQDLLNTIVSNMSVFSQEKNCAYCRFCHQSERYEYSHATGVYELVSLEHANDCDGTRMMNELMEAASAQVLEYRVEKV